MVVVLTAAALAGEPELGVPIAHSAGILGATRLAMAGVWPDPFAHPTAARWGAAFSTPPTFDPSRPAFTWDGDPATLNLVGHGAMGLELYGRPRRCGLRAAESLAFAAVGSAVWEYGFEGNARVPSAQDLVYTPLAGAVLGELRFRALRATRSKALRWVLDPLGEAERALGAAC